MPSRNPTKRATSIEAKKTSPAPALYTQTETLGSSFNLETYPVSPDLLVYRLRISVTVPPHAKLLASLARTTCTEGFVACQDLKTLIDTGQPPNAPATYGYWAVTSELFEHNLLRHGFISALAHPGERDLHPSPYTAIVDNNVSLSRIKRVVSYSHDVFDLNGNIVPQALLCRDSFHNASYNLDIAFKILSEHPQVVDLRRRELPFYNADSVATEHLDFKFCPTAEQACAIHREAGIGTLKVERFLFNRDVLGLRAGKAAFFDTPFTRIEHRDEDTDSQFGPCDEDTDSQ